MINRVFYIFTFVGILLFVISQYFHPNQSIEEFLIQSRSTVFTLIMLSEGLLIISFIIGLIKLIKYFLKKTTQPSKVFFTVFLMLTFLILFLVHMSLSIKIVRIR